MDTAKVALTALNRANDPEPLPEFEFPLPDDVLEVKSVLLKTFDLPLEIIDVIVDYAEYWPRTSVSTTGETLAVGGHGNPREDTFILRTLPLGYFPGNTDNGPPTLPLKSYPMEKYMAHKIESSEVVQATTLDLLARWKHRSRPRGNHPCRKVVFTIKSKDQGWVDRRELRGTYNGSYTWFDVGLERLQAIDKNRCTPEIQIPQGFTEQFHLKSGDVVSKDAIEFCCDLQTIQPRVIGERTNYKFDHPHEPTGTKLLSNRTGTREVEEHVITWAHDDCIDALSLEGDQLEQEGRGRHTGNGRFVQNLQVGDIITIWARARFPGWRNDVKEVKIDVYWAV